MTPTMELRFVERTEYIKAASGDIHSSRTLRILQQKWTADYEYMDESGNYHTTIEWRDVPVEKEST